MKKQITAAVLVTAIVSCVMGQGSLTPTGAPGATMKTLEQVEPRVDLATVAGSSFYHHIINQPGSYYLSETLVVTKYGGIAIHATGVTLDLNGFGISRVPDGEGIGIYIGAEMDRAVVRNGGITGFQFGIRCFIAPAYARGCLFENIAVSECSLYGIFGGDFSRLIECRVHDNTGNGIYIGSESNLSGCIIHNNQGQFGILVGDGSSLKNCTVRNNTGTHSSSYGIYTGQNSTIIECSATDNSNTNSPGTYVHGTGIFAGNRSMVMNCNVTDNKGNGIQVASDCYVSGNNCINNGKGGDGAGIHCSPSSYNNRIENNNATNNDRGYDVSGGGNMIVRNTARGNTIDYYIPTSNNEVGTIVRSFVDAGAWDNLR